MMSSHHFHPANGVRPVDSMAVNLKHKKGEEQ